MHQCVVTVLPHGSKHRKHVFRLSFVDGSECLIQVRNTVYVHVHVTFNNLFVHELYDYFPAIIVHTVAKLSISVPVLELVFESVQQKHLDKTIFH